MGPVSYTPLDVYKRQGQCIHHVLREAGLANRALAFLCLLQHEAVLAVGLGALEDAVCLLVGIAVRQGSAGYLDAAYAQGDEALDAVLVADCLLYTSRCV